MQEGGYIKENNNSVQNTIQKHQQGGIIDRSPFKQMNDKEIQFQLNHVAYNKIDNINKINEENNYT